MVTSRPEQATAAALIVIGTFQAALAAGAPWGRAAYGGSRRGTLPTRLRMVSGVAATAYGSGAALVLRGSGSPEARSRALTALSILMGIGAVTNGASRSPVERALWTPVTGASAVLAWRSRTAAWGRGTSSAQTSGRSSFHRANASCQASAASPS